MGFADVGEAEVKADGGLRRPWETSSIDVTGVVPERKAGIADAAASPPAAFVCTFAMNEHPPAPPMLPGSRASSTDSYSHEESQRCANEDASLLVLRVWSISAETANGVAAWLPLLSLVPEEADGERIEISVDSHTASVLTNRMSGAPFAIVAAATARACASRASTAADCQ